MDEVRALVRAVKWWQWLLIAYVLLLLVLFFTGQWLNLFIWGAPLGLYWWMNGNSILERWGRESRAAAAPYKARWATLPELRDMLTNPGKTEPGSGTELLLARPAEPKSKERLEGDLYSLKPGALGRKEMGHGLLVAPTRRGKGLHLTSNLLNWRGSAIVLDLKGEFHATTSGWRSGNGDHLVLLDPTVTGDAASGYIQAGHTYDPVKALADDEDELAAMAEIMLEPGRDGANSIFGEAAMGAVVAMLRAAALENIPTFEYIAVCTRQLGMKRACQRMWALRDPLGIVQDNLTMFLSKPVPQAEAVDWGEGTRPSLASQAWKNITTRLRPLMTPGPRAMMAGNELKASDLWTRPTTVYLLCPESRVETLRPVLRLIMHSLVQSYMRHADRHPDQPRVPLLLALDETGRVPLPGLPGLTATASGRGISILTYVQDLAQLETAYEATGASEIITNSDTRVYWGTGSPETAERVSRDSGQQSQLLVTGSTSTSNPNLMSVLAGDADGPKTTSSESETWQHRPLITPDEVRQLPLDTVLILSDNRPPIRAERLKWYELPVLASRAKVQRAAIPSRPVDVGSVQEMETPQPVHHTPAEAPAPPAPYFGEEAN